MNWAGKQHPLETMVEWLAPVPLALAAGWAGRHLGLTLVEAAAVSVALLTAGFAAMRFAGRDAQGQPFAFEPAGLDELGELLLEEKDALLELTDPLGEVAPDSRVVRLFERQEPTPGELVDRISIFLGDGTARPVSATPPAPVQEDASAALHAALANIRASLR